MAMLDGGGYVVAYTDTSGLDGNGYGIFARRYDANDNPLGDPFQVNLTGLHTQDEPAVVRLSGGGYAGAFLQGMIHRHRFEGAFEVIETVRKHFVVVERPLPAAD